MTTRHILFGVLLCLVSQSPLFADEVIYVDDPEQGTPADDEGSVVILDSEESSPGVVEEEHNLADSLGDSVIETSPPEESDDSSS